MKLEIVFREQEQRFEPQFESVHLISDGGYERGYAAGYEKGKQDGYSDGYNVGFSEGKAVGLAAGIEQGYADGYAAGYEAGYAEGYAKGKLEGNPPETEVLDPDEVYRTTRPKDWLPMPTPGDDEIYFLCHVAPNRKGAFYVQIGSNGNLSVEYGRVIDGAFVADGSVPNTSANYYKILIDPSMCYSQTADGNLQCFVRIKGAVTELNGAAPTTYEARHCAVDIFCGIALQKLQLGNISRPSTSWFRLRYFRFVKNGGAASLENAFCLCKSLVCITCEKQNIVSGSIAIAFRGCSALIAVSPNLISGSLGAVSAANICTSSGLQYFTDFSFTCSNMSGMFGDGNVKVVDFKNIDTSSCTTVGTMFYNVYCIRSVKNLNISSLTTMPSNWAINSVDLETLTFAGETTPGNITVTLTSACLGHEALVEMIESLPVALEPATVTITGNPGATELTNDEIAVANAKNWTIAI